MKTSLAVLFVLVTLSGCSFGKKVVGFLGGDQMPDVSAQICSEACASISGNECRAFKANVAACAGAVANTPCKE